MTRPDAQEPSLLAWTLTFLWPYRRQAALLSVLLGVQIALGAAQPWPLKWIIDNVLDNAAHPFSEPWRGWLESISGGNLVVVLILIVVGGVLLQVVNHFVTAYATQIQVDAGQRMVYDMRARLFEHLQALGLQHHITTNTGDAVYRIDVDSYSIENLVMSGLIPLATSIVSLVVMFVILVRLDVTVALLSLSIVPFLLLYMRSYTRTVASQMEHVKELESKLIERLYEVFSAIRLVKSFAREPHEKRRYTSFGHDVMNARIAITWRESLFWVVVSTITILGTALVLIVGGMQVLRGGMTVGELTVAIAYLGAVYGPLSTIAHTAGTLQGAVTGAKRVRAVLSLATESVDPPDAVEAAGIRGEVTFEAVSFAYADGTQVLHDISFTARPGEMIALVGLTGAGKTTLVSLIPRFYEPTVGRVLVDGRDVRGYRLRSLRERVAIVLQDPVLFAGTVAENLRYGRLDATDAEVEEAARAAHAHDFVSHLAKRYETPIAEAGGGLSGGERQRLSVARAILKNAPILILDEPTSSLDAISEEIVFAALRRLRAGRTTIVIAHRLSTVRDADRILVLDGGRIAAQGRHAELLQTSRLYRRMCARLSVGRSLDEPESVDELIQAARE
jgi:ABC-type multidrug transport system fused ATPase/permease subunit